MVENDDEPSVQPKPRGSEQTHSTSTNTRHRHVAHGYVTMYTKYIDGDVTVTCKSHLAECLHRLNALVSYNDLILQPFSPQSCYSKGRVVHNAASTVASCELQCKSAATTDADKPNHALTAHVAYWRKNHRKKAK